MQITLKNGLVVRLEWNWLVIERMEEIVGPLSNLTKKKIRKHGEAKLMGDLCAACIQANIDEEMTRDQIIALLKFEDIEKISSFIEKNNKKTNDFAKKK